MAWTVAVCAIDTPMTSYPCPGPATAPQIARLLRELDATRSQIAASARLAAANAASSPGRGGAGSSALALVSGTGLQLQGPLGAPGGASAVTVHGLQMQVRGLPRTSLPATCMYLPRASASTA